MKILHLYRVNLINFTQNLSGSPPLHQNWYSQEKLGNVPCCWSGYWVEFATGGEPHDHSAEVLFATHYHPVSKKAVEDVAKVPWVKARFLLLMAEIRRAPPEVNQIL